MSALTAERVNECVVEVRAKLEELSPDEVAKMNSSLALTPEEHFEFQQTQAAMHAAGVLSLEAAQIIYAALGESMSDDNGGWRPEVDAATKYVVTKLVSELLAARLGRVR